MPAQPFGRKFNSKCLMLLFSFQAHKTVCIFKADLHFVLPSNRINTAKRWFASEADWPPHHKVKLSFVLNSKFIDKLFWGVLVLSRNLVAVYCAKFTL